MAAASKAKIEAPRIIISGGGTGGHIYPAIAIADALKALYPAAEILFVGAQGRMEMQKVPAAGYPIQGLNIAGFQRSFSLKNLSFPVKLLQSLVQARSIIKQFRPQAAVGVGGYASGPLLFAASLSGVPTLIQEQNGYAGVTNKLLARKAKKICVAYPGLERFFPAEKLVFTGNPVRNSIQISQALKAEALQYFGLDPQKPVLLVIGGSLGARTLNRSVSEGLNAFQESGIQVIWQTGKAGWPAAQALMAEKKSRGIYCCEFIARMDLAYNAADACISRAGALSISELSLVHMPVILVPSPNVAEDHQSKNAQALTAHKAALSVLDAEAANRLVPEAIKLMQQTAIRAELAKNIALFAKPHAADDIAREVMGLIDNAWY